MKLTNKQIIDLAAAYRGLDAGRERAVKDGDRERVVSEPFEFTGNVRFAMAMNMNRLDAALRAYNKANAELFRKYAVDGTLNATKNPAEFRAYDDELAALNDIEQDVDLIPLTRQELVLDKNKIPLAVLSGLLPSMPDESRKPDAAV